MDGITAFSAAQTEEPGRARGDDWDSERGVESLKSQGAKNNENGSKRD